MWLEATSASRRVGRQVGEPAAVVPRPLGAGDHHRLRGAGRAHRFHQFGHPRRAVGADALVVDLAAVLPAPPPDRVRLVVEVEDDAVVVGVFGRQRAPEFRRVFGVGHRDDPDRLPGAGGGVVEVEDHVEAGVLQAGDVTADRRPVVRPAVARLDPVDPEPTGLVQRHRHRVDVPRLHHPDRGRAAGTVEEPVALLAHVLGAGAIHPEQPHRVPGAVDEVVAADPDPGLRRRARGGGGEQEQREDYEQRRGGRAPQTATRAGLRTRRSNRIAPSSSGA